jgi:hypothetical protein
VDLGDHVVLHPLTCPCDVDQEVNLAEVEVNLDRKWISRKKWISKRWMWISSTELVKLGEDGLVVLQEALVGVLYGLDL